MGHTFQARYPGTCYDCGGRFDVDDWIEYAAGEEADGDREWRHEQCPREPEAEAVCPKCFLALPKSGLCSECE